MDSLSDPISCAAEKLRDQILSPPLSSSKRETREREEDEASHRRGVNLAIDINAECDDEGDAACDADDVRRHKRDYCQREIDVPGVDGLEERSKRSPVGTTREDCGFGEGKKYPRKRFELEYEKALHEREVGWLARNKSVRESATLTFFLFILYLVIGCLFYSKWEADWPIEESLLFSLYTVTTVGYGNHSIPETALSRFFTIFYILVGIIMITVVVSELCQFLLLEATRTQFKLDKTEIARRGRIIAMEQGDTERCEISNRHSAGGKDVLNCLFRSCGKVKVWLSDNRFGQFVTLVMPFTVLIGIGALVIGNIEGWSAIDSVYWAVVTLSTVGYGDLVPQKKSAVWFTIFYLPFSIFFMSYFLSNVAQIYIRLHVKNISRIEEKLWKLKNKRAGMVLANTNDSTVSSVPPPTNGDFYSLQPTTPTECIMTMSQVLKSVHDGASRPLSTDTSFQKINCPDAKPSFALRNLVKERIARIVARQATTTRPRSSSVKISGNEITFTLPALKATTEKWIIPHSARGAFYDVTFFAIYFVGEREFRKRGEESLFDLRPEEFNALFNPVVASMGCASTLEAWLASTDVIAKNDFEDRVTTQ